MFRKILQSWWTTPLFVCLLVVLGGSIILQYQHYRVLLNEMKQTQKRLTEIKSDALAITQQNDQLEDPDYLELQAKEKLNVKKPGEKVVLFYSASESEVPSPITDDYTQKDHFFSRQGRLLQWWKYLWGH